jgi:hypothetical protein
MAIEVHEAVEKRVRDTTIQLPSDHRRVDGFRLSAV